MFYEDSAWVVAILSRGGGWYCGIDLIPPSNVPVHARVFDQESVLGLLDLHWDRSRRTSYRALKHKKADYWTLEKALVSAALNPAATICSVQLQPSNSGGGPTCLINLQPHRPNDRIFPLAKTSTYLHSIPILAGRESTYLSFKSSRRWWRL